MIFRWLTNIMESQIRLLRIYVTHQALLYPALQFLHYFSCGSSGNIFDLKDLKMGKEG